MGTLFSSKAIGRDPEESDVDEVVHSESETQSDEQDNSDQVPTRMEHTKHVSNVNIPDNSTAAPSDESASLKLSFCLL